MFGNTSMWSSLIVILIQVLLFVVFLMWTRFYMVERSMVLSAWLSSIVWGKCSDWEYEYEPMVRRLLGLWCCLSVLSALLVGRTENLTPGREKL
jgi:hypothetical protein